MSVIYYKFKSAKDYDTVTFDGISLSVFDLKHEIMISKKLGKGTDFDLSVYNAQTGEEYTDDLATIPRNTSIIVRRVPPERPGKGNAQKYLSASGPSTHIIGRRVANTTKPAVGKSKAVAISKPNQSNGIKTSEETLEGLTEEERINAMFQKSGEHWKQLQDEMANAKSVPFRPHFTGSHPSNSTPGSKPSSSNPTPTIQKIPNPTYVCFRCRQKGHFISDCPTLGDKEFDRPKLKRTTGIPKCFLKAVDTKQASEGGVMVTQNGELVVVQPNEQEWKKMTSKVGTVFGEDIYNSVPVPDNLRCSLCEKLFKDAVSIPCCSESYCDECIRNHLLKESNSRMECPNCHQEQSPDNLVPNKTLRQAVEQYLLEFTNKKSEDKNNNSNKNETSTNPSINNKNTNNINNNKNNINQKPLKANGKNTVRPNTNNKPLKPNEMKNRGRNQEGKPKHNYYQNNNQYNMNFNNNNYKNGINMQNDYNKMIPTYMNDNNYRMFPDYNNGWNTGSWDGVPGIMMNNSNRPMMNQMINPQNMGMNMRNNNIYNQMNPEYPMTRGQKVYQTYERRIQFRQQKKRAREMDVIDITDKKAKH
ncbi:DWNN-domain-containing protein [Piromyces finnis]|uniref:DWNN-domain-containing protein n=1 Tax=Piromyces finnis TaxID=1754191 RepID=A0A1Y1VEE0_9FUNG|nr:DWNN-domain-containing protein [Piromyces finnis]|eukprot:ORX53377.1 DWNN-domain-containing protein [Piromyces finnis]